VASLSSFKVSLTAGAGAVQIQRIKEVWRDKNSPFEFPRKALYDKARRTISDGQDQPDDRKLPGPLMEIPGATS